MIRFSAATVLILLAGSALAAAPSADPDWPCVQRKVPSLTPAAIWTGPAIEEISEQWRQDPRIAGLVSRLAARRMPLAEAEAEIAAFARSLPEEERREALTLLFAGLFEVMNRERSEIMEGIERYARRQRALAETIRTDAAAVNALHSAPETDASTLAQAEERLHWNTRIFDERRSALPYICDVPRIVEQRVFALGRAIAEEIPE